MELEELVEDQNTPVLVSDLFITKGLDEECSNLLCTRPNSSKSQPFVFEVEIEQTKLLTEFLTVEIFNDSQFNSKVLI